ncbi:hypothetical protein EDF70_11063 [Neorhizobium sp. JUb45]|nr:hypothetical protein EDF70_11063 [Neorhizobium sp. JUb45]
MPTVISKTPMQFIECCGIVVPISTNVNDVREAYREIALGACIAGAASLPFAVVILFLIFVGR